VGVRRKKTRISRVYQSRKKKKIVSKSLTKVGSINVRTSPAMGKRDPDQDKSP